MKPSVNMPITVLIVDDHSIVREGLHQMLDLEKDFKVVGEARNGRQGVRLALGLEPDVILMDIAMPGLNGLESTRQILKLLPMTKIVMLTAYNDDAYVESAVAAGAVGFLLKQSSVHQVCRAVREVGKGKTFFGNQYACKMSRNISSQQPAGIMNRQALLIPNEILVLQLIALGKTNQEVATKLGTTIETVERHRGNLMEKLDIHDTASLVRYAISAGIINSSVKVRVV